MTCFPVYLVETPKQKPCADVAGYAVWFSLLGKIHRNTQANTPMKTGGLRSPRTDTHFLGTQDFSSLGAAARNGLPPMPRGHPFPKAEFIFAFPTMRLICALHVFLIRAPWAALHVITSRFLVNSRLGL